MDGRGRSLSIKKLHDSKFTATKITATEKGKPLIIKKSAKFTATKIENLNTISAAKAVHFPRSQEVEEVVLLL